jgi:hypothetical protein
VDLVPATAGDPGEVYAGARCLSSGEGKLLNDCVMVADIDVVPHACPEEHRRDGPTQQPAFHPVAWEKGTHMIGITLLNAFEILERF